MVISTLGQAVRRGHEVAEVPNVMLCGVWRAMWLDGRVPVCARRAEWLGPVWVTNAELVEVPTMLARAESLDEDVYRDPIGIFSEGRKTNGVTGCIDQGYVERRVGVAIGVACSAAAIGVAP